MTATCPCWVLNWDERATPVLAVGSGEAGAGSSGCRAGRLRRSCKSQTVLHRKRTLEAHARRGPSRPCRAPRRSHARPRRPPSLWTRGPAWPSEGGLRFNARRPSFVMRGRRGCVTREREGSGLCWAWGCPRCGALGFAMPDTAAPASGQRPHASTDTEASPSLPMAHPLAPAPSLPRPHLDHLTGGGEDPPAEPKLPSTREHVTTHRVTLLISSGAARDGRRARPAPRVAGRTVPAAPRRVRAQRGSGQHDTRHHSRCSHGLPRGAALVHVTGQDAEDRRAARLPRVTAEVYTAPWNLRFQSSMQMAVTASQRGVVTDPWPAAHGC